MGVRFKRYSSLTSRTQMDRLKLSNLAGSTTTESDGPKLVVYGRKTVDPSQHAREKASDAAL